MVPVRHGYFFDYRVSSSVLGVASIQSGEVLVSASDVPNTVAYAAAYPSLVFLPAVAFGVALAYNFPDGTQLLIPQCALVSIFNGTITHWDDKV